MCAIKCPCYIQTESYLLFIKFSKSVELFGLWSSFYIMSSYFIHLRKKVERLVLIEEGFCWYIRCYRDNCLVAGVCHYYYKAINASGCVNDFLIFLAKINTFEPEELVNDL